MVSHTATALIQSGTVSLRPRVEDVDLATAAAPILGHYIVDPMIGLIVLSVLVITGAVAVIREIKIEDEEGR